MQGRVETKRLVALILGVALVVAFGAFVVSGAIGDPSVPDDAVAVVDGAPEETITREGFETDLRQAAFNLQLRKLPPSDDPQFAQVEESALANAIQSRWVRGEAAERGIEVDERDVDKALDTIINEQLGGQRGYEQFLEGSEIDGEPAFTEEEVREVAELTAISDRLQEQALPEEPPDVPQDDVELYYETREDQFLVPETRDVRVILNPDAAEIDAAIAELGEDPSMEDWKAAAKRYSTDEATKAQGGLRRDVAEGQNEPALDEAIFAAEAGELVGPVEGESGTYVLQVEEVTEEQKTPLTDVEDQISQTLQQGLQSQAIETFRDEFVQKWTSRTFCAADVVVELCANADPPPEQCAFDDAKEREQAAPADLERGCPAFALPRNVINPATGQVFAGEQLPALPQVPCGWIDPAEPASAPPCTPWPITEVPEAAIGAPPGGLPIGPDGAPVPPPGAPPQGAPPPAP